jgi:hypothetical protein
MGAARVTTRRAAIKRPREHDTGHVVTGIGFAFECSCGEHGAIRRDRSTAMQEGRDHAAEHAGETGSHV